MTDMTAEQAMNALYKLVGRLSPAENDSEAEDAHGCISLLRDLIQKAESGAGSIPFAYACPATCGCLWRDNGNGTMSLLGPNSRSCDVCEPLLLSELTPLYSHSQALSAPRVPEGFVRASDYMEAIGRMEMIRGASQHCECHAFEIASDYLNETHGGQMPLTAAQSPADPVPDVNYVDAFNGDVPMPAPDESLIDALKRGHKESQDELAKLRERVKVLEELLTLSMRLQVGNTAMRYGAFVMKRGGSFDTSDAVEFLREEAAHLRGGSDE